MHGAEGQHRRAEHDQQHQEGHEHQHQHQEREARGRGLVEVVQQHGGAAHDRPSTPSSCAGLARSSRSSVVAQRDARRGRRRRRAGRRSRAPCCRRCAALVAKRDVGLRLGLRALDRGEHEVAGGGRPVDVGAAAPQLLLLAVVATSHAHDAVQQALDAAADAVAAGGRVVEPGGERVGAACRRAAEQREEAVAQRRGAGARAGRRRSRGAAAPDCRARDAGLELLAAVRELVEARGQPLQATVDLPRRERVRVRARSCSR